MSKEIIDSLKSYGYCISHIDKLFNKHQMDMFNEIDNFIQRALEMQHVKDMITLINQCQTEQQISYLKKIHGHNKYYYLSQFNILHRGLQLSDIPLVELYTQDLFLDISQDFLGCETKIFDTLLMIHPFIQNSPVKSQLWHRDTEDHHTIKCFIYLNDVTEENGPFKFRPNTSLWSKVSDASLSTASFTDYVPCVGPKGTMVFFDGTNIHSGGYVKNDMRLSMQSLYLKPDAGHITKGLYHSFNWNKNFNNIDFNSNEFADLSSQAQKALS